MTPAGCGSLKVKAESMSLLYMLGGLLESTDEAWDCGVILVKGLMAQRELLVLIGYKRCGHYSHLANSHLWLFNITSVTFPPGIQQR